MESPQCLEDLPSAATVTQELCLPTRGTVVRHISSVAKRSGIRNVFVASDSDPDVPHLQQELGTEVSMVTSVRLVPRPSCIHRLQYEIMYCKRQTRTKACMGTRLHKCSTLIM